MRSRICLLVVVLVAAACGGGSDDTATSPEESTSTTTATTAAPPTTEPTPDLPVGETEPQTEAEAAAGSGGLTDYTLIPGPDGSMISETITFSADGETVDLTFDLVMRTAVEFEDDTAVCFEHFSMKGTAEDLPLDGASVTGAIDLVFDLAEPTQCPDTIQDAMGVPQNVDVLGVIEGATFTGRLNFAEGIPFVAVEA